MHLLLRIEQSGICQWIRGTDSIFGYYGILTVHAIGMGIAVGINACVDLRILGFAPALPLGPMEKFLPLVRYNAERIYTRLPDEVDIEDLMSAGLFGLMDAIDAFDLDRLVTCSAILESTSGRCRRRPGCWRSRRWPAGSGPSSRDACSRTGPQCEVAVPGGR